MIRIISFVVLWICLPVYAIGPIDALYEAAKKDDIDTIRKIIADGVDVDAVKEGFSGSPLLTATYVNNYNAAKVLIELGADVNFKAGQWTPLIRAAGRDTRIVKLLIESGADVNYADPKFGYTPLRLAASNRKNTFERLAKNGGYSGPFPNILETVRLLIEAGANINHVDNFKESPLRAAMRMNNLETARILLQAGADVNQRVSPENGSQKGDTILMETISNYSVYNDISSIKLLLDYKANPNDKNEMEYDGYWEWKGGNDWRGFSVLCYSIKKGYLDVVKLLLEYGADPLHPCASGKSAHDLALIYKHTKIAELINAHVQK